jgi:hypothetical protein
MYTTLKIINRKFLRVSLIWTFFSHVGAIFFKTAHKLHDHILEEMENSKYLGVTINNKLNWTQHITNIKGKASRTLGFLQRNLCGCKSNVKSTAYTTMVRPTLEYTDTVWNPHHQITRGGPAKSSQIC